MNDWARSSDTELLLAARRRAEPFGVFYERHVASVLAFFRRRTPGPEETFDLTAKTFAAALASVARFQPGPEPPRAWVFEVMGLDCLALRRSERRAPANLALTDIRAEHPNAMTGDRRFRLGG